MVTDKQVEAALRQMFAGNEFLDSPHLLKLSAAERMRAALIAAEAAAWEPIESAPKDGRRVMLWTPEWETPQSGAVYGMVWACCSKAVPHGGWKHQPTNWRPLPQPPKETT